jgi:ketosteroid isomerase-like protein
MPDQGSDHLDICRRFGAAWIDGDIDALMALCAEDIVLCSSVGPEPGETFRGAAAARRGFSKLIAHDQPRTVRLTPVQAGDNLVYCHWTFVAPRADGGEDELKGIDVFTFREGLIVKKDAYRKTRSG